MAQASQVRDCGRRTIPIGDIDGRHTGLRLLVDRDQRKAAGPCDGQARGIIIDRVHDEPVEHCL